MARPSIWQENRSLFVALGALLLFSNIPYGDYVLYPFTLFSTWVHEMSHGLASLSVGGYFHKLEIFPDTSGMATNAYAPGAWNHTVVASAGYLGTTLVGGLLLILQKQSRTGRVLGLSAAALLGLVLALQVRSLVGALYFLVLIAALVLLALQKKSERIGRTGNLLFGLLLLGSLLFVRNLFGLIVVAVLGGALLASALQLPERFNSWIFSFLAATCGLNALTSIHVLFGSKMIVNGKPARASDAHAVADALFGPYWLWAGLWLVLSMFLLGGALYVTLIKERPSRRSDPDDLLQLPKE